MTTPSLRPTGQAAVEMELLAQLGLPASASPEDVDSLHQAVSDFLSAAPPEIRGWARAQVASLDSAYIQLTDPVGLLGSALRSPASPPTVVPGGPATPPARRGPAPAATPVEPAAIEATIADDADVLDIEGEPGVEDLAALYAMVTPSAHDDMKPEAKKARQVTPVAPARQPVTGAAAPAEAPNVWKRLFLAGAGVVAVLAILVGANAVVNGTPTGTPAPSQAVVDPNQPPAVDQGKVAALMERIVADPADIDALLELGNEYYNGMQFETAGSFFDRVLAADAEHVRGLLARGAVYFNLNDLANAETTWKKVVVIEPDNVEAHYDLGFLYLNQPTPDWDGVKAEWSRVVELDPESDLARTVQAHLDSLVMASMMPGESPDASSEASPAASPAASPEASPAPSAVP